MGKSRAATPCAQGPLLRPLLATRGGRRGNAAATADERWAVTVGSAGQRTPDWLW
jgi:hypothetical protein